MDGISRSRGWDKEIPHCALPMEQLVLSDKWARKSFEAIVDGTRRMTHNGHPMITIAHGLSRLLR